MERTPRVVVGMTAFQVLKPNFVEMQGLSVDSKDKAGMLWLA